MAIKHGSIVTYLDGLQPINSHNPLKCVHERSHEKLKTLYLHHHNAYGHNTYQRSDITQGVPTHKFACCLNEVVM